MQSLKLDLVDFQYFLICECGYKTNIDYFKDVDINFSKEYEPTFYGTGDPRDMTNKEFQEFLEWKEKNDKKNGRIKKYLSKF